MPYDLAGILYTKVIQYEVTAMVCNLGVLGSGLHCAGSCYCMEHAVLGVVTIWNTLYWELFWLQLEVYKDQCCCSCKKT